MKPAQNDSLSSQPENSMPCLLGAIAGDVIGSVYEHHPQKSIDFPFFCYLRIH
jgi:ADP-ribosylglycohydrolase